MTTPPHPSDSRRPGNVAILIAVSLVVLLAMAALALDVGKLRVNQHQLQNAADAAALAGAKSLDGTSAGLAAARSAAITLAGDNEVDGEAFVLAGAEVELGRVEGGAFVAETDPYDVTAVRVRAASEDLGALVAPIVFGQDEMLGEAFAVAVSGGPGEAACPLPVAVPSCLLPVDGEVCGLDVRMSPDTNDSGAWALVEPQHPSANAVRNALRNCTNAATTDDTVTLNNGAIMSALKVLADEVNASATTWDAARWGALPPQREGSAIEGYGAHVLERRLIVFEDPGQCVDTKYTGSGLPLAGFATAVVYDVAVSSDPAQRGLSLRVLCDITQEPGGGGWFGTTVPPKLVE
jgi:hypothetical protein